MLKFFEHIKRELFHLIRCNQSRKRKSNLPIKSEIRAITVYPKEAPKLTIRNQIPTLEGIL